MSGFYSNGENFDRIFINDHQIIENFIGTRAFAFGYNALGNLGDNSTTSRLSPVDLSGVGNNWRQLSGSATASAAVKMDGTLWTWGVATNGVLGNGSTIASRSSPQTTIVGGADWKEVSVSNYSGALTAGRFCAAIKLDGTLYTWGLNGQGQLGSGNSTNRSSPVSVTTITNWLHVACGYNHALAVTASGEIYSWGFNSSGQLGNGSTTLRTSPGTIVGDSYDWIKVAAGGDSSAAIKNEGSLWCWGVNTLGILGDGSTITKSSPVSVAGGGFNWEKVSMSGSSSGHCVATKIDGTLWTWGSNSLGQLGAGTTADNRSSPGTVNGGGTNWKDCAAGGNHSAAIKADGTLWTWGGNAAGQLGDGATTASRSSPATTTSNGVYEWQKVAAAGAATGGYTLGSAVFIG